MFGLVLGLSVAPKGTIAKSTETPRAMRLLIREKSNVYGKHPGYSFVLGGTADERDANAMPVPGPALVLERGKPVAITVVNRATRPCRGPLARHRAGQLSRRRSRLERPGKEILPSIAPGDSLTVRFTPPRTGTFMYHSHFNEAEQISSGLYGPIIVVEPGQRIDADRDRTFMFSVGGPAGNVVVGPFPPYLMNGQANPKPLDLKAGTTYRFRLINISDNGPLAITLGAKTQPATWRAVAKDGADLPAVQATARPAALMFDPGEIYDFEFTPTKAGTMALTFGPPPPPPGPPPANLPPNLPPPPATISVPVRVR